METMITRLFDAVANREKETGPISDADLARAARVKQAAVAYWRENVTASLKSEHAFRIADFLNIDPRWLVTGDGTRSRVGVIPDENLTETDFGAQIVLLIRRLQNLQTELHGILSDFNGLPFVENSAEPSHYEETSSPRAKVDRLVAAAKPLQKRRTEGQKHGKHRDKPGGTKAG